MAVSLEKFVEHLEDSGILVGDTLKEFIPPKRSPKDAMELARELVRQKKLTKFQVQEVSKGNGKSLVLGNYVLLEKIGAGGMGQVFKAEHRRMHRIVAVKLLPPNIARDAAAIARFEREVTAAAKISHPNIVAAYDADCANGIHFLVMECVEGSDLSALVKQNGPLPVEQAIDYILQTAKGLEAAHAVGIVHRDIKPANLLVDKKGTVKILDMGLARIEPKEGVAHADLTNTGIIMGTVDYMAPEQALDTRTADARADIYSLGCSLFYLLTGKALYDGSTLMMKLLAHREQPIPSLTAAGVVVPAPIDVVFQKMVAKKTEERYQTMTQVIPDLEKCYQPNHRTATIQEPVPSYSASGLTNSLKDISTLSPTHPASKKVVVGGDGTGRRRMLLVGGGLVGMALVLAALIISVKTKDGTLVVNVNEPDAEVQVIDEQGKIEIARKGEKGTLTISIDPGKHRLKVQKDGFALFTKEFEIESGGKQLVTAKLVRIPDETPAKIVPVKPVDTPVSQPTPFLTVNGSVGPGKGKHIVLVSGDEEYRSEEALPQLAKILAQHHGFNCTVLFAIDPKTGVIDPNVRDNIPGLEHLKTADLMILFTRMRALPDSQMKWIIDYADSGKPMIGMRTATHPFDLKSQLYARYSWTNREESFGRVVFGETWISHHGNHGKQSTRGIIVKDPQVHPIVRGLKDGDIWGPTDVYGVRLPLPGDSKPLVLGQVLEGMHANDPPVMGKQNDPMMPVAWTKSYTGAAGKTSRNFVTTMGASQDLQSDGLRRLLVNATYWALRMEIEITGKANVDLVGEFKPRPFGFNGYKKGVKPADLASK